MYLSSVTCCYKLKSECWWWACIIFLYFYKLNNWSKYNQWYQSTEVATNDYLLVNLQIVFQTNKNCPSQSKMMSSRCSFCPTDSQRYSIYRHFRTKSIKFSKLHWNDWYAFSYNKSAALQAHKLFRLHHRFIRLAVSLSTFSMTSLLFSQLFCGHQRLCPETASLRLCEL